MLNNIVFQKGVATITDPNVQLYLLMSGNCANSTSFQKLVKSIPVRAGLKREINRCKFALELFHSMNKNGLKIE